MDDGELTQYLKCDIELNVAGPTGAVVQGWTAKALRSLAAKLEAGMNLATDFMTLKTVQAEK